MDGGDQRQSQYGAPYQTSMPGQTTPRQAMGPPSQDSFSQQATSSTHTGMTTQTSSRPYLPGYQFNYSQQPYQPPVQYQQSYIQETPRSHHVQQPPSQHYAQYGQPSMLPPGQQPSIYGGISDYQQQQRQSAAIEVMAGQFGAGSMSNYMPQSSNTSSHYLSTQPEEQSYTSISYGRSQLQPPFAPGSDYVMVDQSPQREEPGSRQAIEAGKKEYELTLAQTFEAIVNSRLNEASKKLYTASEWLVSTLLSLGLHHDDEEQYSQRLKSWRELNHAWEALGTKQKQVTELALRTNQRPQDILSADAIRSLVDKLILLCDQLEKYGLVDYELGLWEEQIVDVFIQCLELLPDDQAAPI